MDRLFRTVDLQKISQPTRYPFVVRRDGHGFFRHSDGRKGAGALQRTCRGQERWKMQRGDPSAAEARGPARR